jgi:hypothetical protein
VLAVVLVAASVLGLALVALGLAVVLVVASALGSWFVASMVGSWWWFVRAGASRSWRGASQRAR